MPDVYYKATRPDGRDFKTGTVDYAAALKSGAPVRHPVSCEFADMAPNKPSTYLSISIEPGDVLIGGSWPCRLFRVAPIGEMVSRTDGLYRYKRGCVALRVVEELPGHMALGPNGAEVSRLLARLERLTVDEVRRLSVARDAAFNAAVDAAVDAALCAAWDAAWDAARGAVWNAAWHAARGAAWNAAWNAAWDAARGAACAILARDLITQEHFDVLYGPWKEVMGDA